MLEDALEILAPQDDQCRVLHRDHMGGARLVVDQRHLAEEISFAEDRENDFAAVLADEDDFYLTLPDDVERITGVVLEEDDGVLGVGAVAGDFHHPLEVGGGKLTEEGNLLQHVGCRHAQELTRSPERCQLKRGAEPCPQVGAPAIFPHFELIDFLARNEQ